MSETFTVRAANADDLAGIDELLRRSYPALLKDAYPPSLLVTAIPLISKAQPKLIASGTYFVVEDGDLIVGAGGWTRSAPGVMASGDASIGNVRHVVTDHRRVREGIGAKLMRHVIGTAKDAGIEQLECFSTLLAVKFYAAFGFEEIGPMSINLSPAIDFPAVHMRKML